MNAKKFTDADTDNPLFLTPHQLSERWQVSTMTLRRWTQAGRLKAQYFGRSVRYAIADIKRLEALDRI